MKHRVLKSIGRIAISGFVIAALILTAVPFGAALNTAAGSAGQSVAYGASKKMTVKFNGNGGTVSKAKKRVTIGKKYGTLPTAARGGYAFKGWYSTKKSGGKKITKNSKVKKSYKTLYARWGAGAYTITFNGNGGRASFSSKAAKYKGVIGALPTGTKSKYLLAGWYTQAVGGTKVTPESIYTWKGNVTLYAHWIIKAPVNLANLDYFTKDGSWYTDDFTDNEGVEFIGWYNHRARDGEYINFLLDCNYYELNGKLCLASSNRNTSAKIQLKIYCDNVLVHTTGVLTSGVRPIRFPVIDLTNVEQLKFEVDSLAVDDLTFGIDAELKAL